jgi:hypothetical protein
MKERCRSSPLKCFPVLCFSPLASRLYAGACQYLPQFAFIGNGDRLCYGASLPVENDRFGDAFDQVVIEDRPFSVDEHRQCNVVFIHKSSNESGIFVGDREDHESSVFQIRIDFVEDGFLSAAGTAPGRPEIQQYHLATQILEMDVRAVDRRERETIPITERFLELGQCDSCLY